MKNDWLPNENGFIFLCGNSLYKWMCSEFKCTFLSSSNGIPAKRYVSAPLVHHCSCSDTKWIFSWRGVMWEATLHRWKLRSVLWGNMTLNSAHNGKQWRWAECTLCGVHSCQRKDVYVFIRSCVVISIFGEEAVMLEINIMLFSLRIAEISDVEHCHAIHTNQSKLTVFILFKASYVLSLCHQQGVLYPATTAASVWLLF